MSTSIQNSSGAAHHGLLEQARFFKQLRLTEEAYGDLCKLASGAYPDLDGFMRRAQYEAALTQGQPIVTLPLPEEQACNFQIGDTITLQSPQGRIVATMLVQDKWMPNLAKDLKIRFGTADPTDPRVASVLAAGPVYLGGPITML